VQTRQRAGHGDDGFSAFELMVATVLMGVLGGIIFLTLPSIAGSAVRTTCATNVSAVDTAITAYTTQHPDVGQLTVAQLTATGSGTLNDWPTIADHSYLILIAGDGNRLNGVVDAIGQLIRRNDIVVQIAGKIYDSTRSFAAACATA
jgi:type II secretory pathway pseudopilin PulG